MSKTNLVSIGCSFTSDKMFIKNPNKLFDVEKFRGYPVWPTLLAKKLKMDVVNLGKIGAGNKYIFDQVFGLEEIDDIGFVVCMWSGWSRENVGTEKTLSYMVESQRFIKEKKLPYIFIQGVHTYPFPRTSEIRKLIDSPYFEDLENDNFMGWPIFSEIGGWCIEDKMKEFDRFSVYDRHPNKNGHEKIANILWKHYD